MSDADDTSLPRTRVFVNGEPFQPESVEDFSAVLDEALAE